MPEKTIIIGGDSVRIAIDCEGEYYTEIKRTTKTGGTSTQYKTLPDCQNMTDAETAARAVYNAPLTTQKH